MLRSVKDLQSYTVHAEDGEVGSVYSFLINDRTWVVMYIAVEAGNWIEDHKVLISPVVVKEVDWRERSLLTGLTRKEIKERPDMEEKSYLPLQNAEEALYEDWPIYWEPILGEPGRYPLPLIMEEEGKEKPEEKEPHSHMRSSLDLMDYFIHAKDGEIGHVEDFITESGKGWRIRYVVVDTRNLLPGKKVLISPQWIQKIDWREGEVYIDHTREEVKASPEFDPHAPVNREYEEVLYDYYGRPKYWSVD